MHWPVKVQLYNYCSRFALYKHHTNFEKSVLKQGCKMFLSSHIVGIFFLIFPPKMSKICQFSEICQNLPISLLFAAAICHLQPQIMQMTVYWVYSVSNKGYLRVLCKHEHCTEKLSIIIMYVMSHYWYFYTIREENTILSALSPPKLLFIQPQFSIES